MYSITKLKQAILLAGDIIILYLSLGIMLLSRYDIGGREYSLFFGIHLYSFSIIFIFWIFIFYIAGLYDLQSLKNNLAFMKRAASAIVAGFIVAIIYFYIVPVIITPKTNLVLFVVIFSAIASAWRYSYNILLGYRGSKEGLLIVGSGPITAELISTISQNPQLGYRIGYWMKEGLGDSEFSRINQIVLGKNISTIVIPSHIKKNTASARAIYQQFALGIEVIDVAELYERIVQKVPLVETEEVWFLENIAEHKRAYDAIRDPLEKLAAIALLLALAPLLALIGLCVAATSRGGALIRQVRVGKYGRQFTLYKFRSMYANAEKNGAQWAKENDKRVTLFGAFLRYTHLDELPQLWNIIKGDISFVGPRPERPEFVSQLNNEVPYYELRHLTNPGVTGWAQINYRYGASVKDAYEKLQYDLYYLKHRSFLLDVAIVLRTLKLLFIKIS